MTKRRPYPKDVQAEVVAANRENREGGMFQLLVAGAIGFLHGHDAFGEQVASRVGAVRIAPTGANVALGVGLAAWY